MSAPIGIFDSGYGGLTILREIKKRLPDYDYLYLGDNARTPYGTRSFEVVYQYTLEAVRHLFDQGCQLVILACNTASAKALRTIQQTDLPTIDPDKRVLGIIYPTVEVLDRISTTKHIGLFATVGTVQSDTYSIELAKNTPHIHLVSEACPMWVPLVENNEFDKPGADYFVRQHVESLLAKDPLIDTIVLGCTHYPLLRSKIESYIPSGVKLFTQGRRVAESLADYLSRHPEIEQKCSRHGGTHYLTTESPEKFCQAASLFLNEAIEAIKIEL